MMTMDLQGENKVIKDSEAGTLYDIGDGVLCLQMHTRVSALNPEIIAFMKESQEELARNWEAMVVAGSGKNFCIGSDISILGQSISKNDWEFVEQICFNFQEVFKTNKYSQKPVVAAVHGMTLGGGCEIALQSSAIQADVGSKIGLVEVGVGLIPAGGGIRETVMKAYQKFKEHGGPPLNCIAPYFQNVTTARVSRSAEEALQMGYLRPSDGVSANTADLIADAKKRALDMIAGGYTPPEKKSIPAFGQSAVEPLKIATRQMVEAGQISEYDGHIANGIADIMAGGSVITGAMITEEYLDSMERDLFVSLCREEKTQERIAYMLKTGKPLRN
jgi:3-hydroxyacyl-CoA dehydrogenase